MKIVFIINSFDGGGAERVVSELANHISSNHEIYLITVENKGVFYTLSEKTTLINLDVKNNKNSLLNSYERISKTYKTLKKIRPNIVISFMTSTNIETTIVAKLLKLPIIIAERANPHSSARSKWHFLRKRTYPLANLLVCQTESSQKFYESWIRNIRVIPNPLKQITTPVQNEKKNILLAVGRLGFEKGHDLLIRAFSKMNADNWTLLIVGEGQERATLENLIATLSLDNRVTLFGRTEDVDEVYQKALLFVLPSRTEGFPNALCEAMAHGLPCISFDCDFGPRDIITHGKDGILVPPEDVDALAAQIQLLIDSPEQREALGREAIKIQERLSIKKIAKQWEDCIDAVVDRK